MTKKSHLLIGGALVVFGIMLSGCELGGDTSQQQEVSVPVRPGVTLKGKLVSTGNLYYIQEGSKSTEIVSKKIDLKLKVGTEVEVYGEFSGTTLYVDEVK